MECIEYAIDCHSSRIPVRHLVCIGLRLAHIAKGTHQALLFLNGFLMPLNKPFVGYCLFCKKVQFVPMIIYLLLKLVKRRIQFMNLLLELSSKGLVAVIDVLLLL